MSACFAIRNVSASGVIVTSPHLILGLGAYLRYTGL